MFDQEYLPIPYCHHSSLLEACSVMVVFLNVMITNQQVLVHSMLNGTNLEITPHSLRPLNYVVLKFYFLRLACHLIHKATTS